MTDLTADSVRVALVTGASRGIGRAIALALADHGYLVIGTATSDAGAEAIGQALAVMPVAGHGLCLNVNEPGACETAVADIVKRHGRLDVLVNNAGITRDNLALRMKDEEWQDVIDTNLSAAFRLDRAVLKPMVKARWGRILHITSVVGTSGNPGQINYAASKAGLGGLSRSLAREVGSRGITVNCIAPGFIQTDMTDALSQEQVKTLVDQIPLQRLGTVSDIAASVVFLCSEGASYITGTTLHVNGGMVMS
ncbi:MAG: 3-oxoacyl-ACP reductase FabG [Burkholderiaceae bacterium]|jgi:3-oxoacyl-[acyl-carrier protein] reductase|nr:3-oxoacyl-ACP reductase FabG [Pseudomonadota bacterium]MDP4617446.1 3-oxoacyl-ACP reductase FabG [Burkholderiaceae bacterium]HCO57454.1 3-oxoacyl-ACP reductase [Burkholderiales bacterium]MDA1187193.1 3-oxoacyl-ACP reductase FabG [Pseudomonadota bacterium]MDP4678218.1 3-oxoacyl-ACP reductase FabG [Burkholderiaceae bacterium]